MAVFSFMAVFLFIFEGVIAKVQLEPQNATVLQHSEARFNCCVNEPGWTVMIWSLNRLLALTILETSGVVNSTGRFSASDYSTGGASKWEFIIENVLREDSGQVTCQIQGSEPVTAQLSVQESGAVEIEGANRTATEGEQVTFQCLAVGWFPAPLLSWALNGMPVPKELFNSSFVEAGTVLNSSSSLGITASSSVLVECLATVPALGTPERSGVFLTVAKVDKPQTRDQTVLIAVTVSFSAAALLVLIIIAIVLCCKRKKGAKNTHNHRETRIHTMGKGRGMITLDMIQKDLKQMTTTMSLLTAGTGKTVATVSRCLIWPSLTKKLVVTLMPFMPSVTVVSENTDM